MVPVTNVSRIMMGPGKTGDENWQAHTTHNFSKRQLAISHEP